jgi:hypothetical protein
VAEPFAEIFMRGITNTADGHTEAIQGAE